MRFASRHAGTDLPASHQLQEPTREPTFAYSFKTPLATQNSTLTKINRILLMIQSTS